MDILWRINVSSFNECVSTPTELLADSIGRIYIVELKTYAWKWCYFTLIGFLLGFMSGSWDSIRGPLLFWNSSHMKVGEAVPKLYPRTLIYLRIPIIVMVLRITWMNAIYSLSVDLMDISVWSWYLHINGNPKYDTTNHEKERAISESSIASYDNQLLLNSASANTLASLSRGWIYIPSFQLPSGSTLSYWQPHHAVLLVTQKITHIGAPFMQCLVEYFSLSS